MESSRHRHFVLRSRRGRRRVRAGGSLVRDLLLRRKVRSAEGPPPKVSRWLAKYGQLPIKSLTVCRKPINAVLDAIIRGVLAPASVPYDKLYHLWLHVELGEDCRQTCKWKHFDLEKNELVKVVEAPADPHGRCADHLDVSLPPQSPPLTLIRLFANARHRHSDKQLWIYDPVTQNCQRFVWDLLSSSGLGSPQLEQFIVQDARKVIKPGAAHLTARAATDLASYLRRLAGGHKLAGGNLRGGQDEELDRALAMIPMPDTTVEAQQILANLPDPAAAALRPPTRQELQAAQAHEIKRDLTKRNALLAEIPQAAARINPRPAPKTFTEPWYHGSLWGDLVLAPAYPPQHYYGTYRWEANKSPFEQRDSLRRLERRRHLAFENLPDLPGEIKYTPPVPPAPPLVDDDAALLLADFDEIADAMHEGDGLLKPGARRASHKPRRSEQGHFSSRRTRQMDDLRREVARGTTVGWTAADVVDGNRWPLLTEAEIDVILRGGRGGQLRGGDWKEDYEVALKDWKEEYLPGKTAGQIHRKYNQLMRYPDTGEAYVQAGIDVLGALLHAGPAVGGLLPAHWTRHDVEERYDFLTRLLDDQKRSKEEKCAAMDELADMADQVEGHADMFPDTPVVPQDPAHPHLNTETWKEVYDSVVDTSALEHDRELLGCDDD